LIFKSDFLLLVGPIRVGLVIRQKLEEISPPRQITNV